MDYIVNVMSSSRVSNCLRLYYVRIALKVLGPALEVHLTNIPIRMSNELQSLQSPDIRVPGKAQ